jgi:restriction system protein
MPIPDYQTLMLPLLRFAADGNDHTTREAVEGLATEFQLTPAERKELLASGQQAIFNNRVGWANSYLKKAGLLESPRRGALRITARGKQTLGDNPTRIDVKYLERFPAFIEFRDASRNNRETTTTASVVVAPEQTPEEALELAHQSLRLSLAQDILGRILSCSLHSSNALSSSS